LTLAGTDADAGRQRALTLRRADLRRRADLAAGTLAQQSRHATRPPAGHDPNCARPVCAMCIAAVRIRRRNPVVTSGSGQSRPGFDPAIGPDPADPSAWYQCPPRTAVVDTCQSLTARPQPGSRFAWPRGLSSRSCPATVCSCSLSVLPARLMAAATEVPPACGLLRWVICSGVVCSGVACSAGARCGNVSHY
jgi:hypothetical protein